MTGEAIAYKSDLDIAGMTNEELGNIRDIVLLGGDLQFQVKGFVRHPSSSAASGVASDGKKVALLVEGGTITFGEDGMVGATGDALSFIDIASGVTDTSASDEAGGNENSSASNEARKLSSSPPCSRRVIKGAERKLGLKSTDGWMKNVAKKFTKRKNPN